MLYGSWERSEEEDEQTADIHNSESEDGFILLCLMSTSIITLCGSNL